MATTTFTATVCETKYYDKTDYYSYTVTQQGYRYSNLMVGFVTIPSLQDVDWTKYKITAITATFNKTYGGSGHTAWFWRSAYQSVTAAHKGSAYVVTDSGHAEVDGHAEESGSVSTTLSASAIAWFQSYLREENPQVFCVYNDSTSNDLYFNGFSLEITYEKLNQYTLSYNANGGTGAPSSQTAEGISSATFTIASTVPTKTGYTFMGWATSVSGEAAYQPGGSITVSKSTTLYAVWQIKTYTVSYKKGTNGTGTNTTATKTYGVALTLKGAIFTRTGYTQTGWATSDGGSKAYDLGGSYTKNASVTLYPVWSANTCTVTLDPNGGTVSPTTITATLGQAYGTLPTPTKTGGTFGGWMLNGQLITAETICSTASNHTLTAYWSTVTCFYVKRADGSMKPGYCFRKATDGTMTTGIVYQKNADGTMTTV